MKIDLPHGNHCFIIGHHVELQSTLNQTSAKLLEGGFRYFNIFGERAPVWKDALSKKAGSGRSIEIEASTVAREEMCYTLAMLASMKPDEINFVLSDDFYFT